MSPVFSLNSGSAPSALSASQSAAVRRHCQTMALWTGRPEARSHRMVVSRWLAMPTARTSEDDTRAAPRARARAWHVVCQISSGSCSTQPARGKRWGSSA